MEKQLIEAFAGLGSTVVSAIPKFSIGIVLIILALIFARIVEVALRTTLVRVRFDSLIQKAGVTKALKRVGLRQELSVFIPKVAYFLVIFLIVRAVSDAFGLFAISTAIGAFFSYLPNILAALLLLILGTTLGQFAGRTVAQAAESSGIDSASLLGKVAQTLIVFVVAMMAMGQLRIDTQMVRIVTCFVLGAAALAFGLSFGLGTWTIVRNIVIGFYARKFLAIGKSLEIAGQRGILTSVTATHTILASEGSEIIVANSTFLEKITKLDAG
jgi:Conserved TM helix/Mechanosensitive ion channel